MKLPKRTVAAILTENRKPLVVSEIELPTQLHFGHVLVKIHYATICGAQINEIDGAKGPDKYLPHLLGHEASGTVMAIGEGVTTVKIGDLVVLHWRPSSGIESIPAEYRWNNKPLHAGWVTTFQELTVVSENRITPIPRTFNKKIAPLFGCAVTTAFGVINNDANVKVGQSVVIFGVGGVGVNIVQAASMVSAYPIVAIDIVQNKLTMAMKFGATDTILSKSQSQLETDIRRIIGQNGADVVIDTTGNARVIELCYALTSARGKTVLVGVPKKGDTVNLYTLPLHFEKTLHGSHGGSSHPDVDIPNYIRLYNAHKLTLDGMITHTFPIEKINEAINVVRSGHAGRVAIRM